MSKTASIIRGDSGARYILVPVSAVPHRVVGVDMYDGDGGYEMSNIKVSYAEIETAASQLGAGREEITAKLQAMQNQIRNLVASGFVTDQASGKFNDAYTKYTTSANTLIAQLNEIQAFLTGTANAMRDLDSQIAAKIN